MDKELLVSLVEAEAKLEVARSLIREVQNLAFVNESEIVYYLADADEHLQLASNIVISRVDRIKIPF